MHSINVKKNDSQPAKPPIRGCSFFIVLVLLFTTTTLHAESHQHAPHQHGIGELNIALEAEHLFIELQSPAANIVGFEHKPSTEKEENAIHYATKTLKNTEKLFLISPKANCNFVGAYIESELLNEEHDQQHADYHSSQHGHSEEHDHGDAHSEESGHSDFSVTYTYTCQNPKQLKSIDVILFSTFRQFEELEVQLLTSMKQRAIELTPKHNRIEF